MYTLIPRKEITITEMYLPAHAELSMIDRYNNMTLQFRFKELYRLQQRQH